MRIVTYRNAYNCTEAKVPGCTCDHSCIGSVHPPAEMSSPILLSKMYIWLLPMFLNVKMMYCHCIWKMLEVEIVSQHSVFRLQLIESSALNLGGNFGDSPGDSSTVMADRLVSWQRSNMALVYSFSVAECFSGRQNISKETNRVYTWKNKMKGTYPSIPH